MASSSSSSTPSPSNDKKKYVSLDPSRLQALRRYEILDSPPEETFDRISDLAAALFDVPVGLITFVEDDRQWHKACVGFDAPELDLDSSFCVHTLEDGQRLVVEDATDDERFEGNPLVTGDRHIRFYAGSPMTTPDGHVLGTVCVLGTEPHSPSEKQLAGLDELAQMAVDQLERRRRQKIRAAGQTSGAELDETRLNELLASLDDVVWEVQVYPESSAATGSRRKELLYTNSSEENIFGRPTDALVQDPMLALSAAHPRDQPDLPGVDALLERGSWRGEYRILQPDGSPQWVETSVQVVGRTSSSPGEDETLTSPVKLAGVTRSVHRRHQAEASLREKSTALSEEKARLRVALGAADAGVFEWSVPEDRRTWDERARQLFGLDAAPRTTGELIEHVHPDDRGRLQDVMARALGDPDRETCQFRYRVQHADGDTRRVHARAKILRDEKGEPERLIGIYQDVTERWKRTRQLRRSERQFEAVFQDPNMFVGLLDLEGTLRGVNDTALSFIQEARDDVLGQPFWETPWWDHDAALQADLQEWIQRAAGGEYVAYQSQHVDTDGLEYTIRGSIRPVTDEDGAVTALIASGRDVTAREDQRRELEVLHQAVEDAADGMAVLAGDEYVYVDQTHAELYGFDDKEQLLGNTWRMLYGDEEVERLEDTVFPVLEEEGHWQGLVTGQQPDGSTFPAALSLTLTEAGRLVCTVRDMTGRQERSRRRQLLLTASETGIAEWDLRTGQVRWDGMLRDSFGHAPTSTEEFFALVPPDDRPWVRERFESVAESASSWNGEFQIEDGDGRTRWVEALVVPIFDDGEVARLLMAGTDATERKRHERELRIKERAMNEANVGIQIIDPTQPEHPLVYVNEGFEEQTGYHRDDVLGRGHQLLQGPDTDPGTIETIRSAIDAEEQATVEVKTYRDDGTPYWSRLSLAPVYSEEDTLQNYVGIRQDITEQRRQTEMLRERQRKLDLALAETSSGLLEWDFQTGEVRWDETLQDRFGHAPTTFDAFTDLVHPNDRSRVEAALEEMIDTGTPWSGEFWVFHPDEAIARMKLRATPIYEDGEAIRALGIATDVTTQHKRDRALAASRKRYEELLQATPDPVFLADADTGRIVEANAAAADLLGRPLEEIVGIHQTDLHPSGQSEAYASLFESLEGNSPMRTTPDGTQIEVVTDDGTTVPVEINATTVDLPDGRVVYGVFRDISDRRTMQEHLTRRERRFRMMFEHHSAPMLLIDEDTGAIERANAAAVEFYGHDPATLTSMSIQDINQLPAEEVSQERRRAAAEGEEFLFEHELASGEVRTVRVLSAPVPDLDRGGTLLFSVIHDVTERETHQQDLADQKAFLEQILDTIDDVFYLLDEDGDLVLWNDSLSAVTGYTDAELETMTALDFFGDDATRVHDAIEAADTDDSVRVEASMTTKDGRKVRHEFTGDVFQDPERGRVLCGIGRDITEREDRRQALRHANQRFEQFAETVPNALFIVSLEYSELYYANGAVEKLYGVNRDTLHEHPSAWTRHVHPQDLSALRAAMEAQSTDEARWPQHQEFRVLHPTRGRRWLSVRLDVIDSDDPLQRLAGVATDVTKRKTREQRLRVLHRTTRDLLDVTTRAGAASIVVDALSGTLGLQEAAVYLRDGDLLKKSGAANGGEVGAVPQVEKGHSPLWTAFETGEPQVYPDPDTIDDGIDRSSLKACAYVPVGEHGALVVGTKAQNRLGEGEVRLLEIVARTLRDALNGLGKKRDLVARERRYRTLAENIPNGAVFLFDDDLTYTLAVGELIGTYELEESDLIGAQVGTVLIGIEGGRHPIVDRFEAALDGERTDRRVGVGGRTLRVQIVPLQGEAEARGLLLAQDVTEEVRRERELFNAKEAAEEANQMKSTLLANMSHEIRTPLTSILGFAEAIEEETQDLTSPVEAPLLSSLEEFAGLIQHSGQRLMDTFTDVLNLSRLKAGDMDLPAEETDLSEQARAAAEELRPQAEEKGIGLEIETGEEPIRARANADGVQIVLRNLVSNAIKYTDDGSVSIRARREDEHALLEVEDTGIGMDPEVVPSLFEAFRQESEGMGREYEGVGLGLTVTKRAVERMNGSIEVETEKGVGSRFIVRLPRPTTSPQSSSQGQSLAA
ncbi:PAS domain S-box protein [Salinibacter grassmerensis]|uniref:PAS domain S-box protein n=1 Tax=Salinibacter grassmerensis TaxID=3040353 RepID=UPI0021E80870|nr:PAS domain S-box protein [Salinibacter grassmerensis]